jgi:hypothetical protein
VVAWVGACYVKCRGDIHAGCTYTRHVTGEDGGMMMHANDEYETWL